MDAPAAFVPRDPARGMRSHNSSALQTGKIGAGVAAELISGRTRSSEVSLGCVVQRGWTSAGPATFTGRRRRQQACVLESVLSAMVQASPET